ncbi:MAG: hypothetical protein RJB59_743 [Actinomycetota bacterium]
MKRYRGFSFVKRLPSDGGVTTSGDLRPGHRRSSGLCRRWRVNVGSSRSNLFVWFKSCSGYNRFSTGSFYWRRIWLNAPTNLTGAYLLPSIPERLVLTGFALVLITAGVSMLVPAPTASSERKISPMALIAISLIIGALTGLFGIGGGFLAIPILILFYNVAPAKAAGTSLFIIAINTLTGFFAHFRHWDEVNWAVPALMALTALVVSRFASHHSSKLSPATLKQAFAVFVFAIAIFTLVDTWVIS